MGIDLLVEAFNPSEARGRGGKWIAGVGSKVHVASELRYIGRGTITSREPDTGNFHVKLDDGRTGRVAPDQVFRTQREARTHATPPNRGGWSDAAKLNTVGRRAQEGLLEGFASNLHPRDWHGRFRVGDVVRVKPPKSKDGLEVVGRIQRFTENDTAIISPEHGGAHIEAKASEIAFHSPNSHRSSLARRSNLDPGKPADEKHAEFASDRLAIDQEAHRRAEAIGSKPRRPDAREPSPAQRSAAQTSASKGQGAGQKVWSSGKLITPAQKRRLSSVVRDITVNARQDKPHMDAAISKALRDSGHTMGKTPGWMDKLHTNHASVLIKELERLARHGPGEDGKPFEARESALTLLLEGFASSGGSSSGTQYSTHQAQPYGKIAVSQWSSSKHPRAAGGKFGYTTGGKRATRGSPASGRYLANGSRGALVSSLQRQLGIPADGVYGPQTRQAVMRYQQQHGLTVDGVVGAQTLAALRGNVNARSIKPGPIASRAATVRRHPAARVKRAKAPLGTPNTSMMGGTVV